MGVFQGITMVVFWLSHTKPKKQRKNKERLCFLTVSSVLKKKVLEIDFVWFDDNHGTTNKLPVILTLNGNTSSILVTFEIIILFFVYGVLSLQVYMLIRNECVLACTDDRRSLEETKWDAYVSTFISTDFLILPSLMYLLPFHFRWVFNTSHTEESRTTSFSILFFFSKS